MNNKFIGEITPMYMPPIDPILRPKYFKKSDLKHLIVIFISAIKNNKKQIDAIIIGNAKIYI
jgi:hypothetical protein